MNPAATEFLKQSGKVGGNVLSNALAYSLATHGDKAIGKGLQMAGDLAGLFFGASCLSHSQSLLYLFIFLPPYIYVNKLSPLYNKNFYWQTILNRGRHFLHCR